MRSPVWLFWSYVAALVPFLGCLLVYGLGSPWYRSRMGRAMFTLYAAICAVLALAALMRLFRFPHPVAVALILLTLGAVALAGCVQFVAIVRLRGRDGP